MKLDRRTLVGTLWRCLKLQCPVCGRASLVQRPFHVKHRCEVCGALFKREEGFFVGAIMANVIATEAFVLLIYFAIIVFTNFNDRVMLAILFVVGVTFPLAFYHHG